MKTYDVRVYRDGKWWMVEVPELDGITQALSEGDVERMARDYIATVLEAETDTFDMRVMPKDGARE